MTQSQLVREANCSRMTVWRIIRSQTGGPAYTPHRRTRERIAAILGLQADQVFAVDEE